MGCSPRRGEIAEIRCSDIKAKNLDEFKAYMAKYELGTWGDTPARFIDVNYDHTGRVRLFHRKQSDIMRHLLNYMGRDRRYTEKVRNCQAFAADLYSFVAGKKDITVHSKVLKPMYTQRTHLFLYEPSFYNMPTDSG